MDEGSDARFGDLLRRRRVAAGLSQEELAERSGLSRRGISDLERGERTTPRLETVRLLAEALALDASARAQLLAAARPEIYPAAPTPASPAAVRPASQPPGLLEASPAPLPIMPTRLVGREREAAEIVSLLERDDVRLVTLTGPGGVGKTRLAVAVADAMGDRFTAGAALVELAPLTRLELVASAVASTLIVAEEHDRSLLETLKQALRTRNQLLIFDNFEHLLPAALLVSDLLSACPMLKVLVTSRERLHLRGEREVAVGPLALPAANPACPPPLAGLAGVAAVRLFVDRAEEARRDFALTEANAAAVAEICRRLDGLPLAIELAAAWIRLLPPDTLLERLRQPLPLLAEGPRDLPKRQQTLTATIAWSHDLLRLDEQAIFRRLSIFAGGFPLDGAEAVGAGFAGLAALLDKALVRQTQGAGGARFSMLETIRHYALDCLVAVGDEEEARARHAAWCLKTAERGAMGLRGAEQAHWFALLGDEHDNMRAALQWALDRREAEIGLRLCGALWRYWFERGQASEGRRWLEQVHMLAGDTPSAARANALYGAGALASQQSDHHRSTELFEESLTLYRSLEDREGEARCLNALGVVALDLTDYARATILLEDAHAVLQRLDNRDGMAVCLINLGNIAFHEGDYARAAARYEAALVHRRALGEPVGIAVCLSNLGLAVGGLGDNTRAAALFEEGLMLARSLGTTPIVASCLGYLGGVSYRLGDLERARQLYEESVELWQEVGDDFLVACTKTDLGLVTFAAGDVAQATALFADGLAAKWSLGSTAGLAENFVGLAQVAVATQPERAARLLGVIQALREQSTQRLSPTYQGALERVSTDASDRLGAAPFARARAVGRALPLVEAVGFALGGQIIVEPVQARQT